MAQGTALSNLLLMLKAEIGVSTANTNDDAKYTQLLNNKQQWLSSHYDFPFLEHQYDVQCPANTQYVAWPTMESDSPDASIAINFDRPIKADVYWNSQYNPLDWGIGVGEYNYLNFQDLQQVLDPIQRVRYADEANFEVWPVPASQQKIKFTAQRVVQQLVNPTDKADLDDMLLVYFVAADYLARLKQADAPIKLQMAQERLRAVTMNYNQRDRRLILGQKTHVQMMKRIVPMVVVAK